MSPSLFSALLGLLLTPVRVLALEWRNINLGTGVNISYEDAMNNLVSYLAVSIGTVTTVLFLVGATYMLASGGVADRLDKGKKLMKESLIGMAIVLGSYTILRTVLYFLF